MPCKDSWPGAQMHRSPKEPCHTSHRLGWLRWWQSTGLRGLRGQRGLRGLRGYTRKTFFNLFHAFFVDGFTLTSGTSSFAAPEEDDTSDLCYNMLRHVTTQQYSNLWFMTSRRQRPTYVRWFQFAPKLSGPKTSSMPGYSLITSRLITHLVEERQWLWGSCRNRK